MINKIKDFVKNKLARKATDESIDQDELLDQENLDEDTSHQMLNEDKTGETNLPDLNDYDDEVEFKPSWKDKFKTTLPSLTSRLDIKGKFASLREKLANTKLPSSSKKDRQLLSPSLSRSIDKFLAQESRETVHQVALILIVTSLTYSIGKITALTLRGAPMIESSKNYSVRIDSNQAFQPNTLAQVKNINIFRTNTGLGGKKQVAAATCIEAQQSSSLPIKLVNTVVLQDSIKSIASVQVRGDRILQEIREGDQISNLAKVFKITRLDVLVKNLESGVCESISSSKGRETNSPISVMSPAQSKAFNKNKKISGIDNVGNKYSISKVLIDEKMKDIAAVLTQARAIKMQNPDGTISFKLTEMDPEGIFPYLGLEDQDIITAINGKPIYDMNEVMGLFSKIKNLDNLSLGIKREGSDSVKEYSIKK